MMARALQSLLLALLLALPGTRAQAQQADFERILSYHSDIEIQADASVIVTEEIRVRSLQDRIRRGIYRDFPTRYRDRYGNRVRVAFEVLEVLRDGRPEPWFTEHLSNGIRVNTGNDDFLPGSGDYTFTIRYRTTRQIGFFEDHDELYWNVTGLGWAFSIDKASARVRLPAPVPAADMRLDAYTGPEGSTASNATAKVTEPGVAEFQTTRLLLSGHGLTIAVGFPKGLVEAPTGWDRLKWLLIDNRAILVLLLGMIGILIFYWRSWLQKGRGPAAGVIVTQYEPPESFSPAGLRYVMKERYDQKAFTADLVALAVKGRLSIERENRLLGDRWSLIKQQPETPTELPPTEEALNTALFLDGPTVELKKSSETATRMQKVLKAHKQALHARYKGRYIEPNTSTVVTGWVASIALGIVSFILSVGGGAPLVMGGLAVLLGINILFSFLMPAPTEEGRKLRDRTEGLKRYLSVAEKEELSRLEHRSGDEPSLTPERYEALLPFAMALEVESAWTDKFTRAVGESVAEQTQQNLRWYSGSGAAAGSLSAMSQSLSSGLSSSISSASTPPGSSSGGGGGGFSGGGGGGGGGGGR
ncbi:DUF2207 domain-containing protein [Wenzhouxiangella marina]|uniref:Uncharacterized protein n=1 Tax=Wenzhouxiangella marina TaxID=1579979 RepID=A0A0K0XXV1_9GAMM|nr:DUF2207 domain-containing protein [Wenzhouxiangella marina]AKS42529.1 hypothetical protein WM2015_2166 [Wenzhouxiangella marina]MBB6085694.1 putative membrane protein YgcG [Wenzhouxiangella marina]